jgi:hypothetical protein
MIVRVVSCKLDTGCYISHARANANAPYNCALSIRLKARPGGEEYVRNSACHGDTTTQYSAGGMYLARAHPACLVSS